MFDPGGRLAHHLAGRVLQRLYGQQLRAVRRWLRRRGRPRPCEWHARAGLERLDDARGHDHGVLHPGAGSGETRDWSSTIERSCMHDVGLTLPRLSGGL